MAFFPSWGGVGPIQSPIISGVISLSSDVHQIAWAGTNSQGQGLESFQVNPLLLTESIRFLSRSNFILVSWCVVWLKGMSWDLPLKMTAMLYTSLLSLLAALPPSHILTEKHRRGGKARPRLYNESVAQPEIELSKLPNS